MKIAILFDGASAFATHPDAAILETVNVIDQSLASEGNDVGQIGVFQDGKWIEKLRRGKYDLVFNMCEGIDGVATLEAAVISVLELFRIPFTGSSSYTAAVCLRKHVVNGILEKSGLPVPRFAMVRRGDPLTTVGFPAIVKPAAEDASIGIEQRSVVRNTRQLAARVDAMLQVWDEVLIQRYIDGREVNVGILGDTVLPIAEIDFGRMPAGRWRIVTYQSKWETGSVDDLGSVPRCPARLPAKLANEIRGVALKAWKISGGFGYGRVDMRIDSTGRPWILEVNGNPDISPDAGIARMARTAGIEYPALIRNICELALARAKEGVPADDWERAQDLSGIETSRPELDLFANTPSTSE